MITQALPMKVPEFWFTARPGVVNIALHYGCSPDLVSAELLKRCCAGTMQLWLIAEEESLVGFFITEIVRDEITRQGKLNIYLLYLYKPATKEIVEEGRRVIEAFAKGNDCQWITFTTNMPDVVLIASKWWPGWELFPSLRRAVV